MTTSAESVDFVPVDTSDLDRWLGVPVAVPQQKDPFSTLDIRRYAEAVQNVNRLHYDDAYAVDSRFEGIVAPQSYFGGGSGTGARPAVQGRIAESHMLFGGDEFWFYGPRVYPGDLLRQDAMAFDYRVTDTSFAGPTVFARGDTTYVNQRGEFVAKQRSTSIRYLVENARKVRVLSDLVDEPQWSDQDIEGFQEMQEAYIDSILALGHEKRLFASVSIGDKLPPEVIGPHTIQSFTSEKRAGVTEVWGSAWVPVDLDRTQDVGFVSNMAHRQQADKNPIFANGLLYGGARGHTQPKYAQEIGMPRGYGYGATMGAWCTDYLSNWGGEWSFVRHARTRYTSPALTGDVTIITGEVIDTFIRACSGKPTVRVKYEMTARQTGSVMASGIAEIELPAE